MKRNIFITFFLGTHLCMAFIYITLRTCIISQSFINQRKEKYYLELKQKKELLHRQLIMLHNETELINYAQCSLGMVPLEISKVKMVDLYEQ